VFALVNSMIGGTMLTLPLLFRDSGLITSAIILVLSGFISLKTCNLYMQHLASDEKDIQDSVKRILRGRWYEFFCLITGVYLIMLNVLYIVLINDQLYNIIKFALAMAGKHDSLAPKTEFTFGKMSEQWLAVITYLPLLGMLFIKNLGLLVRMTAIGVWSVFIYFIFVGYAFVDNINQGQVHPSQLKLFSWDIGNLAGTAALAFTIHTVVAPIMRTNKIQSNNTRDLVISYMTGTVVYAFIGICGSMAIESTS
jgi:amino acid permease